MSNVALQTQVTKLNRRGIIAWEADGVIARLTKKQSQDIEGAMRRIPLLQVGAAFAQVVKERVAQHGQLAEPRPKPGKHARVFLSYIYAALAGAPGQMRGRTFKTTAEMYARLGVVEGSYNITGGMWSMPQARTSGQNAVVIDLAGTSQGRGEVAFVDRKGLKRKVRSIRPIVVRNQEKATAILKFKRVHVLRPTDGEEKAIGSFVRKEVGSKILQWLEDKHDLGLEGESNMRARLERLGS